MVQASNSNEDIVKIIDFGPFLDGSNKQVVADAFLASFKEVGFVYLVNHGLSREKMDQMFEWVRSMPYSLSRQRTHMIINKHRQSKKFFSQPTEIKQLAPHPASGAHHRGSCALWV